MKFQVGQYYRDFENNIIKIKSITTFPKSSLISYEVEVGPSNGYVMSFSEGSDYASWLVHDPGYEKRLDIDEEVKKLIE